MKSVKIEQLGDNYAADIFGNSENIKDPRVKAYYNFVKEDFMSGANVTLSLICSLIKKCDNISELNKIINSEFLIKEEN